MVYRDRGCFGVKPRGYDATMRCGVRGHPLGVWDRFRNGRISRRRAPAERAFAVLKHVFDAVRVLVTTKDRVHIKMVFTCFYFNLFQMATLGVTLQRGPSTRRRRRSPGGRGGALEALKASAEAMKPPWEAGPSRVSRPVPMKRGIERAIKTRKRRKSKPSIL